MLIAWNALTTLWVFVEILPCVRNLSDFYEVQGMQRMKQNEGIPAIEGSELEILKSLNIEIKNYQTQEK
jgi:hypothetical protein